MKSFFRALQFFRPEAPRIAAVFALLLLSIATNLLKPWPLAIIVDSVLGHQPLPGWLRQFDGGGTGVLLPMAGAILLLHAGHGALSAMGNYLAIKVGLEGLKRVRNELFACLQRLSLRFHQGSKTGDLIYRATWDTYAFQTLFQQGLFNFATAFLSLVMMVVVMWRVNVPLTLAAVGTVPLLLVSIKLFGRRMRECGLEAQEADSQVASLVQQNIATLPLIQSYTREEHEEKNFTAHTAAAEQKRLSQHGWELLYWLGVAVVFGLGTAAIVWLGSQQVHAGKLSIGQLIVFLAYLGQLYDPLNQLSHVGTTLATASASIQRVFEVLDAPQEVKETPNARPVLGGVERRGGGAWERGSVSHPRRSDAPEPLLLQGQITFDHVGFAYEKDQPVLRDISFRLGAGESAAILGPSGVGKTTLLNLLPRFFDPTAGAVQLDGVDARKLRLKDLRAQIALLQQEPILLTATLAENIAYGKPAATQSEIEAAARAANAAAFIEKLPRRYDTVVGEGGAHLSVGERQRINLARAFLKDAPVLLLDEPTNALDAESEALVLESLRELMRTRTTLVVAHRVSTIQVVNRVLVLQEGRLAEFGKPAELLQRQGYYAHIISGETPLG